MYKSGEIIGEIVRHLPNGEVQVNYGGTLLTLPAADNELPNHLTLREFNKKYIAQHKDIRGKQAGNWQAIKQQIIKGGFEEGINTNALPIYDGIERNVIDQKYGNRKGDIVYILPKEGVTLGKNGYKTKEGYKPKESEVVVIEYDKQPTYEAYINHTKGGLLAPNGKQSNLTPEQYHLVRTPAFKAWFGDWELSPATASKMVDDNGEPLVCYHGTPNKFNVFRKDVGHMHDAGFYGSGFYFTFNKEKKWMRLARGEASYYGNEVMDCFLKTIKPFDISSLSVYKGKQINAIGAEALVFLYNIAIKFPDLAESIFLDKKTYNPEENEYDITKVPISILPGLFTKYAGLLKTFDSKGENDEPTKWGYVKSEVVSYVDKDGKTNSWESTENLGPYSFKIDPATSKQHPSDLELELYFVEEALEKYEGIEASYYPEGYMTRNPQITEAIMKNHDAILQSEYGDEIVVFEPTQIKLADGTNTTFDGINSDIRFKTGGLVKSDAFEKWFAGSKVVDKDGNPLVVYHGTQAPDFSVFQIQQSPANESYGSEVTDNKLGFFFTDKKLLAEQFAGISYFHPDKEKYVKDRKVVKSARVIPCYLSIKNPYIIDENHDDFSRDYDNDAFQIYFTQIKESGSIEKYRDSLIAAGFDGIALYHNTTGYYAQGEYAIYVAFAPEQIKIADGSNTTFDANNPDIYFFTGGSMENSNYLKLYHSSRISPFKIQQPGESFLSTEGNGIYASVDKARHASAFGGNQVELNVKKPKKLIVADRQYFNDAFLNGNSDALATLQQPISNKDSAWLRINKQAIAKSGYLNKGTDTTEDDLANLNTVLTHILKDNGYDAVFVHPTSDIEGGDFYVILDVSLIMDNFGMNFELGGQITDLNESSKWFIKVMSARKLARMILHKSNPKFKEQIAGIQDAIDKGYLYVKTYNRDEDSVFIRPTSKLLSIYFPEKSSVFSDGGKVNKDITVVINKLIESLGEEPFEINSGSCDAFAVLVKKEIPEVTILSDWDFKELSEPGAEERGGATLSVLDYTKKIIPPNFKGEYGHCWIYYNGKHYDAQLPEGSKDMFDIPIWQMALGEFTGEYDNRKMDTGGRTTDDTPLYILEHRIFNEKGDLFPVIRKIRKEYPRTIDSTLMHEHFAHEIKELFKPIIDEIRNTIKSDTIHLYRSKDVRFPDRKYTSWTLKKQIAESFSDGRKSRLYDPTESEIIEKDIPLDKIVAISNTLYESEFMGKRWDDEYQSQYEFIVEDADTFEKGGAAGGKTITVKVPISSSLAWNAGMEALGDLTKLSEEDFIKAWKYVLAANYMFRTGIEISDYKHGKNHHVLHQSGAQHNVDAVNAEFKRRKLDKKYSLFIERKETENTKPVKSSIKSFQEIMLLPDLDSQRAALTKYILENPSVLIPVAFSGGKDSIAMVLHLLELGVPKSQMELWHHDVDGHGEELFDWHVTPEYCQAFADAIGIKLLFSYRSGGIVKRLLRNNEPRGDVYYQTPDYQWHMTPSDHSALNTGGRWPSKGNDMNARWCSSEVKIDVASQILSNDPRLQGTRENPMEILLCTGERHLESDKRATYAELQIYKKGSFTANRKVLSWRPIIEYSEERVWELLKKWNIQPHPCYYLGWGRCSCQLCIFNEAPYWAASYEISPEKIIRIRQLEIITARYPKNEGKEHTLYDKMDIFEKATMEPPVINLDTEEAKFWIKQATEKFTLPIFVQGKWKLPSGAFKKENCGAS